MAQLTNVPRAAVLGALATAFILGGGFVASLAIGIWVSGLPMHVPQATRNFLSAIPVLLVLFAAGAAWGSVMARISGSGQSRRSAWAGLLSFGPGVILAGISLALLEVAIVERGGGRSIPIHVLFTLLFVPAVFLVAGIGGLALGFAQRQAVLAIRLALGAGLAAALAFLAIDLLMDALGWRVGAPGAAERATMLTVMMIGNLAAALAGGGMVGFLLTRRAS